MGNPIQYRNTDNKGGFHKTASVHPPGAYPEGELMKTLHRQYRKLKVINPYFIFWKYVLRPLFRPFLV